MRRAAAFTIVQNEPAFLPLWLDYYRRYFNRDDLYVLDHDSDDGSTTDVGTRCTLLQVHRDRSFDHGWLNATVSAFQTFLLHSYERVLFAEADEFVVADPVVYDGLRDYIERCQVPLARCTGFEVVHYPDEESRLDFTRRPVLTQRRYWHASRLYSKPLLSSIPTVWSLGFHDAVEAAAVEPDDRLFLVHLHRVDYESCVARHQRHAARNWNETDLAEGRGFQNRLVEGDERFRAWFFNGVDNTARAHIPERLRTLL